MATLTSLQTPQTHLFDDVDRPDNYNHIKHAQRGQQREPTNHINLFKEMWKF